MKSKVRQGGLGVMLSIALCAAGCVQEEGTNGEGDLSSHEQELIGGDQVASGKWDSAIFWSTGSGGACSGSVVGPRHILTAAHCVQSYSSDGYVALPDLRAGFERGANIGFTNDKELTQGASYEGNLIESVDVHPEWTRSCTPYCEFTNGMTAPFPPDLAVITLQQDISDRFPRARILSGALLAGSPVSIMGYGCEVGVSSQMANNPWRLKAFDTFAANAEYVSHANTFVRRQERTLYERHYVITPGKDVHENASLCPGDSGGALYLTDDSQGEIVVGVNAYYTFRGRSGVAITNAHTRLGRDNPIETASWLYARLPQESFVEQTPFVPGVDEMRLRDEYDVTLGGSNEPEEIVGNTRAEHLIAFDGDDALFGDEGDDLLEGGKGGDVLDGGLGHDVLFGNAGPDLLDGGEGEDILIGGLGPDVYVFAPWSGHDLVLDDMDGQNRVTCQSFDEPPEVFRQGEDWIVLSRDRAQSMRIVNSHIVSFYGCGKPRATLPF